MSYYIPELNKWKEKKDEVKIKDASKCERHLVFVEDGYNMISGQQIDLLYRMTNYKDELKYIICNVDYVIKYIKKNNISKNENIECNENLVEDFYSISYIIDDNECDLKRKQRNYMKKLIEQVNDLYNFKEDILYPSINCDEIFDIPSEISKISENITDYNDYIIDKEDHFDTINLNGDNMIKEYTQQKLCLKQMKMQLYNNQNKLLKNYDELQTLYYELINKLHNILLDNN